MGSAEQHSSPAEVVDRLIIIDLDYRLNRLSSSKEQKTSCRKFPPAAGLLFIRFGLTSLGSPVRSVYSFFVGLFDFAVFFQLSVFSKLLKKIVRDAVFVLFVRFIEVEL